MPRRRPQSDNAPTREQAATLELVSPLLTAVTSEMRELSKKKQDGILSTLKVRSINRLLTDVQEALGADPSVRYLDLLDDDDLPQNSDAVLVLTQWEAAVKQYRARYQRLNDRHQLVWVLGDGEELPAARS